MREDFKVQRLGKVLNKLVAEWGWEQRLDEARAVEAWRELAGDHVNKHTRKVYFKRGRLHVFITSSVWRHQLHMQRSQWVKRLNDELGKDVISEIVYR